MTLRQKRIIAALAIANGAIILALIVLVARSPDRASSSPLPTPTRLQDTPPPRECQRQAAQMLAQAGLGGTVRPVPDQSLQFKIIHQLAPGETADQAAQQVWTAFDVALALMGGPCGAFPQVEVEVLAQSAQGDVRLRAGVSTADLMAFHAGELGESEFIDRVDYATNSAEGR